MSFSRYLRRPRGEHIIRSAFEKEAKSRTLFDLIPIPILKSSSLFPEKRAFQLSQRTLMFLRYLFYFYESPGFPLVLFSISKPYSVSKRFLCWISRWRNMESWPKVRRGQNQRPKLRAIQAISGCHRTYDCCTDPNKLCRFTVPLDGSRDTEIKFQGYDGPIKFDSDSDSISEDDPRFKASESSSSSSSDYNSDSNSEDFAEDSDDDGWMSTGCTQSFGGLLKCRLDGLWFYSKWFYRGGGLQRRYELSLSYNALLWCIRRDNVAIPSSKGASILSVKKNGGRRSGSWTVFLFLILKNKIKMK